MTVDLRLDLHVHSRCSPDSSLSLAAIGKHLAATGLRGFALTDHNSIAGFAELAELARAYPGCLFLPGVEVSTLEGHLLAYGISELPPARRPIVETVAWVEAHGGVSVLAHPFRLRHGAGRRLAETLGVVGIEARNGHCSEASNLRAERVAARRGLATTGGSDVHALADLGRAFTCFPDTVTEVADLLGAIRRRATVPGGRSLPWVGRVRLSLSNGGKFVVRGFRSV